MAAGRPAVEVVGLKQLRAALREISPAAARELRIGLRAAAGVIAAEAQRNAPRGTGRTHPSGQLAASIKAGTSGASSFVRSGLPYAGVHEYGGTIRPRGVPIEIDRSFYIGRALAHELEPFIRELELSLDRIIASHGWH